MKAATGDVVLPRAIPPLLAFVAGYVDAVTFLALFGFFAAQVTGSFVIAAAELVVDDRGVAAKMLAIPAFIVGAAIAAAFIIMMGGRERAALMTAFALEAVLLTGFVALTLHAWPIVDPDAWRGIFAGLLSAAAMGVQSTLVRLLLRGVPQTNVMTGNTTQLAIDGTDYLFALFRRGPEAITHRTETGQRMRRVFLILLGFLAGASLGAVAYAYTGPLSAVFAIFIVGGLLVWSFWRPDAAAG